MEEARRVDRRQLFRAADRCGGPPFCGEAAGRDVHVSAEGPERHCPRLNRVVAEVLPGEAAGAFRFRSLRAELLPGPPISAGGRR